jgi:hypothetical protein
MVLSHKIYGRGSNERLIAKAAELAQLNPVADTMRMPARVRAHTAGMLPEVLAARRIF